MQEAHEAHEAQAPANFNAPIECHGQNCPPVTHIKVGPGMYKDVRTGEVLSDQPEELELVQDEYAPLPVQRRSQSQEHPVRISQN